MNFKSIKINDTTREERIEIIRKSLCINDTYGDDFSYSDGISGIGDPMDFYCEYINGNKEIAEINMGFNHGLIK